MLKKLNTRAFLYRNLVVGGTLFCMLTFAFAPAQEETLRINEFMALNSTTITDKDGEFSDWIEIYNPTDQVIDLFGWSLTDRKDEPQKWQFPAQTLAAKSYLLVFASGKNYTEVGEELHTNFALSGSGEYLGLIKQDGDAATEFDPAFPEQQTDISFAYYEGDYVATSSPTPGGANQISDAGLLPPPVFSVNHGFYDASFQVEMTSELSDVKIYYTTGGEPPRPDNWTEYTDPVQVTTTTLLRAVVVKAGVLTSKVTTNTYLFLDDVINQPNNPPGYPAEWGPYSAISGNAIADYEMDSTITEHTTYGPQMKDALLALPTLSLVTDKNHFFSHSTHPDSGGIYIYTHAPDVSPDHPSALGDGWERPVSVELFTEDGSEEFQVNAGIMLHGGHSRRAEKSPKHSFRLVFKSEYGPGRLGYPLFGYDAATSFNTIVLRAGFGNTWIHHLHAERLRGVYARDEWGKETQLDMGHLAGHGRYVHLYINGMYWGIYNATERLDKEFAESYLPGNVDDFDIIKDYAEVADGFIDDWDQMMNIANEGLNNAEPYQRIQGNNLYGTPNPEYPAYVDVVSLIDYMILNFYGGNTDWDHHNWVAMRNRVQPGKGFQFFSWDAEHILKELNTNVLDENNPNAPSFLFQRLRENADFRRLFSDRVQHHFFNGGAMSVEAVQARWGELTDQIEPAIIAESARWGDYRRDVHQYQTQGPFELYGKTHWQAEQDYLVNEYFPYRMSVFLDQLRQAGLFPNVTAPQLQVNGNSNFSKEIQKGDILTMTTAEGAIYFTTDGSDPAVAQDGDSGATVISPETASKSVHVPKEDIGTDWRTQLDYGDSGWQTVTGDPGGVGYEQGDGYQNQISLNVGNDMYNTGDNPNTSCYIRIKFNMTDQDIQKYSGLTLEMRYDDGFVAYINGTTVAEANAPDGPGWNSSATTTHEANGLETFNISSFVNSLEAGQNLLAIHGLNRNTSSSDFIINCRLLGSEQSDPAISPSAMEYTEPVELTQSTHIKARALNNDEWSALTEAVMTVPLDVFNLKLTEIHYHPLPEGDVSGSSFEFVELKNIGAAPIDLTGVRFEQGISYSFPVNSVFAPGEFIVLASNEAFFIQRYGFVPNGVFKGALDNAGERLTLLNAADDTIFTVCYDDYAPWPTSPDGEGYSLVPVDCNPVNDQDDPNRWRASFNIHGSPGVNDETSTSTEELADTHPKTFQLQQNYPNPFNPSTTIEFNIPINGKVILNIYNILGQKVITLANNEFISGQHKINWNGNNSSGHKVSSGLYIVQLVYDNKKIYKRMMLLR